MSKKSASAGRAESESKTDGKANSAAENSNTQQEIVRRFLTRQLQHLVRRSPDQKQNDIVQNAGELVALVNSLGARDSAELMLASQCAAIHYAAMATMAHSSNANDADTKIKLQRSACRLMTTGAQLLTLIDKRQGKNQQKITVEHVNVDAAQPATLTNRTNSEPVAPAKLQ